MTKFEDMKPNDSASLIRRIEALERQVQQAGAARRLEAATIGRGGITVQGGAIILKDADGNEIGRMGVRDDIPPEPDGDPQPGFILRRNDGSIAFTLDDPNPLAEGYRQLLKMQDADGNIIFMEDYNGGWGLAAPTFTASMYPSGAATDWAAWPASVNAAFEEKWRGYFPAWNPSLTISAETTTSIAATTGEVRLLVNGIVQAGTLTSDFTSFQSREWIVDLATIIGGAHGSAAFITIEARRVAGTGKVHVVPRWVLGMPSTYLL